LYVPQIFRSELLDVMPKCRIERVIHTASTLENCASSSVQMIWWCLPRRFYIPLFHIWNYINNQLRFWFVSLAPHKACTHVYNNCPASQWHDRRNLLNMLMVFSCPFGDNEWKVKDPPMNHHLTSQTGTKTIHLLATICIITSLPRQSFPEVLELKYWCLPLSGDCLCLIHVRLHMKSQ
jgi:hypothetical protein